MFTPDMKAASLFVSLPVFVQYSDASSIDIDDRLQKWSTTRRASAQIRRSIAGRAAEHRRCFTQGLQTPSPGHCEAVHVIGDDCYPAEQWKSQAPGQERDSETRGRGLPAQCPAR
jgi:hypothetical protein